MCAITKSMAVLALTVGALLGPFAGMRAEAAGQPSPAIPTVAAAARPRPAVQLVQVPQDGDVLAPKWVCDWIQEQKRAAWARGDVEGWNYYMDLYSKYGCNRFNRPRFGG